MALARPIIWLQNLQRNRWLLGIEFENQTYINISPSINGEALSFVKSHYFHIETFILSEEETL